VSIQAVAWVLEHSEATLADRLVLIAIANHVHLAATHAWPGVDRIAAEARVDRATVYRSLSRLVALGELEVTRGGGRGNTNAYTLKGLQAATDKSRETVADCDTETVAQRNKTVASTQKNGRSSATQNRMNRNEPSRVHAHARPDLPPELSDDVKARGAEFFRALRRGEPA
jgi:hypothetical protein